MIFKVLLILTIVLQFASTMIAAKLTKRTKFNSAWILFAIAMLFVNAQLIYELIVLLKTKVINYNSFMVWSIIIISLCLSVGVFYLEKIISYIEAVVRYRQMYEKKVISSMIKAEERERQRIAKELHDGVGPLLSSAKMSLSFVSRKETTEETRLEMLSGIEQVVDESIRSVREVSNNLSPNVLNSFGLVRAINNFINKLALPPMIEIKFTANIKKERYSPETEIVLYRICCELINNAIKHSKGTRISLIISSTKGNITLNFKDNGVGFDYKEMMASDKRGLGLSNMENRVDYLGGKIEVKSGKDAGTETIIVVPVK